MCEAGWRENERPTQNVDGGGLLLLSREFNTSWLCVRKRLRLRLRSEATPGDDDEKEYRGRR